MQSLAEAISSLSKEANEPVRTFRQTHQSVDCDRTIAEIVGRFLEIVKDGNTSIVLAKVGDLGNPLWYLSGWFASMLKT